MCVNAAVTTPSWSAPSKRTAVNARCQSAENAPAAGCTPSRSRRGSAHRHALASQRRARPLRGSALGRGRCVRQRARRWPVATSPSPAPRNAPVCAASASRAPPPTCSPSRARLSSSAPVEISKLQTETAPSIQVQYRHPSYRSGGARAEGLVGAGGNAGRGRGAQRGGRGARGTETDTAFLSIFYEHVRRADQQNAGNLSIKIDVQYPIRPSGQVCRHDLYKARSSLLHEQPQSRPQVAAARRHHPAVGAEYSYS